jgi:hypothetical protein
MNVDPTDFFGLLESIFLRVALGVLLITTMLRLLLHEFRSLFEELPSGARTVLSASYAKLLEFVGNVDPPRKEHERKDAK